MGPHCGLNIESSWALSVLRPTTAIIARSETDSPANAAAAGMASDVNCLLRVGAGALTVSSPGGKEPLSADEALARVGLESRTVMGGEGVYLLRGEGGEPRILPGKGMPRDGAATRSTWPRLVDSLCGPEVLGFCAAQYLQALASRLEELTGWRTAPCDSFTVSVDGSGSVELYQAVADAISAVFGVAPTFVWRPTAMAGWSLTLAQVQSKLVANRAVTTVVRSLPADQASPPILITADNQRDGICTAVVAGGTADAVELDGTAFVACAVNVRGRCASVGAALWGWWRTALVRPMRDSTGARFVLIGRDQSQPPVAPGSAADSGAVEVPSPATVAAPAIPSAATSGSTGRADAGILMLDVTLSDGGDKQPRWFARAVEVKGQLAGPVPLKVCARFPWSGATLVLAGEPFSMADVQAKWRGRFSVAVHYDGQGSGSVFFIRPDSSDRTEVPFTLLPEPRGDGRGARRAALSYETIRQPFRSLPNHHLYDWELDVASEALLLMGTNWRLLPRNHGQPVPMHVLRFSSSSEPLHLTVEPHSACTGLVTIVTDLFPGLRLHEFALQAPASVSAESDLPADRIEWSLRTDRPSDPGPIPAGEEATSPALLPARPRLSGELRLAPPDYGLLVELRWEQAGTIDVPYPVGRRADQPAGSTNPMATGLLVNDKGITVTSLPTQGRLLLSNLSDRAVRLQLTAGEGVRMGIDAIVVPAGGRTEAAVIRRRTLIGRDVSRYRDAVVQCLADPATPDDTGPAARIVVGAAARATDLPTLCLPDARVMSMSLASWLEPGNWRLPLEVAGAAGAEVILGVVHSDVRVRGEIPPDEAGSAAARHAYVPVMAQPTILLAWFPGPMGALAGELEVRHGRAAAAGLAVTYRFKARIDGVVAVVRTLDISYEAGLPFAVPFDLLVSDESYPDPKIRWRWEGESRPYAVSCELLDNVPTDLSPPAHSGRNGNDQGSSPPPPRIDPPRLRNTTLPEAAQTANPLRRRWLRAVPQNPSGWEQATAQATIELIGSHHEVLDEVRVTYAVNPLVPRLGVRLADGGPANADPTFEFTVSNVNLFRAVRLMKTDLSAEIKGLGIKMDASTFTFDNDKGPVQGERLEAGEARAWTGRLTAGRHRMLRSLRRFPMLAGMARFAGKRAQVDLSLSVICEGRSESPYTYRAEGEVEIQ